MNQKELFINFVFGYTFYLTLFVLVGIINGIFAYMLWVFHRLVTDFSPSTFKFFNYLKLKLMPPTEVFFLVYSCFCCVCDKLATDGGAFIRGFFLIQLALRLMIATEFSTRFY